MKKLIFLLLIIMGLCACKNNSNEPVLLRLNLQKGETFNTHTKIKTEDSPIAFNVETTSKIWVDAIHDEEFSCRINVLTLKMHTKNKKEDITYNSSKKDEDMSLKELELHNSFKEYINKDFTFKVDQKGSVYNSMRDEDGNYVNRDEVPMDIENFFPVFPDKSIKPGDTWEGEKNSLFGENKSTVTYTLKKISGNEVVITFVSVGIDYEDEGGKIISKGEYILSKEKGRLLKYKMETMQKLPFGDEEKVKITQTMEVRN